MFHVNMMGILECEIKKGVKRAQPWISIVSI